MKTVIIAAALAAAIVSRSSGAAQAQECLTFATGEVLCDDGSYAYYWSPSSGQWHVLDRDATAAALGLNAGQTSGDAYDSGDDNGSTIYGGGGSLTSTDDGCTMYSSPGYSFGESFSFSSGC
jgi:hypothetical protein